MLYHQATRDYYQESISHGAEELFVTLIVHCTLVPRIANVFVLQNPANRHSIVL